MLSKFVITWRGVLFFLLPLTVFGLLGGVSARAQVCGDGTCNPLQLETCLTCTADCGSCPVPTVSVPPLLPTPTPVPSPSQTTTPAATSTPTTTPPTAVVSPTTGPQSSSPASQTPTTNTTTNTPYTDARVITPSPARSPGATGASSTDTDVPAPEKTHWWVWGMLAGIGLLVMGLVGIYLFRKQRQARPASQEYISTIVHELRTPLTAMKGYLALLLKGRFGPVEQAQKGPLADVASSAERLSGIVNDMLDASSLAAGKLKLKLTPFAIDGVVQEVLASLQPLAQQKHLVLEVKNSSGVLALGDRDRVKQILINLLGNSLKFTDSGNIRVSSESNGKIVKVFVANTGPSIPPEKQKLLFQKFEQLSNKPGGTGLGLSIARELARAMGGDLWLEKSEAGEETVFAFSLPQASMVPLKEP